MTKHINLVTGFAIALALLSSVASAAVRQSAFLGLTSHTGTVGTLIDGNFSGTHFFCFSYVTKVPIEKMDLESPPPSDDACTPEHPTGITFNIGTASDCAYLSTSLRDGDIVRWKASFKKPPKLNGDITTVSFSGIVSPDLGLFPRRE